MLAVIRRNFVKLAREVSIEYHPICNYLWRGVEEAGCLHCMRESLRAAGAIKAPRGIGAWEAGGVQV